MRGWNSNDGNRHDVPLPVDGGNEFFPCRDKSKTGECHRVHQCEGRDGATGKGIHLIEKNPNPSEQYENYRLLRGLYPSNPDGFPVPLVPHRRGKKEGLRAGQAGGRHPLSGGAGPGFPEGACSNRAENIHEGKGKIVQGGGGVRAPSVSVQGGQDMVG